MASYKIVPRGKLTTIGDHVKVSQKKSDSVGVTGVVKFIGQVKGKTGIYYGLELDASVSGGHNGSVSGISYFKASSRRGLMVKKTKSAILKTISKDKKAPRVTVGSKVVVAKADC